MKIKEIKKEESIARKQARAKRTNQEQLSVLDKKLGKGIGAKKERARLINKEK